MKKALAIAFSVIFLFVAGIIFVLWDWARIKDWGIDVPAVDVEWLPAGASNVTFVSSDINRIAEFEVDRDVFETWCRAQGKALAVIEGGEPKVSRAYRLFDQIDEAPKDESEERFDRYDKLLEKGDLFFEKRWPNNGGYTIDTM